MYSRAYLEITNICNRSCAFCPGTRRVPHMMTAAEFRLLAGKIRPFTDYLYLHVMGEPLLHPELGTFLHIAKALGFRVVLTTNGTLLSQRGNGESVAACCRKRGHKQQDAEPQDHFLHVLLLIGRKGISIR